MSERAMVRPSEGLTVRFGTFDFQGFARISTGAAVICEHHPSGMASVQLRDVSGTSVTMKYAEHATRMWREHLAEYPLARIVFVDIIEDSYLGRSIEPAKRRVVCKGWVERRGWFGRRAQLEDPNVVPRADEVRAITDVSWEPYRLPPELCLDLDLPPDVRDWPVLE